MQSVSESKFCVDLIPPNCIANNAVSASLFLYPSTSSFYMHVLWYQYLATRRHHKGIFIHVIKIMPEYVTVHSRAMLTVVTAMHLYVSHETVIVLLDI